MITTNQFFIFIFKSELGYITINQKPLKMAIHNQKKRQPSGATLITTNQSHLSKIFSRFYILSHDQIRVFGTDNKN
jgi:hypothetical protein